MFYWSSVYAFLLAQSLHLIDCATPLDWVLKLTPRQFVSLNEGYYKLVTDVGRQTKSIDAAVKLNKLQTPIPKEVPFPCDVTNGRSPVRPTSVHKLRPGDIDVVGAMGDSLTVPYGSLAANLFETYVGYRGVSFSAGGHETWRTVFTLPNILKEYNPNLIGYSTGNGLAWNNVAQFNVAEGMAISNDMPYQATMMIKRMQADKRVNFEEDWKVVTIQIGTNDFCSFMCYQDLTKFLANHAVHLANTMDILYKNLPRVIVNVIPALNAEHLTSQLSKRSEGCLFFNAVECSCIYGAKFRSLSDKYSQIMEAWKQMDLAIGLNPRYQGKKDFAVVVQPFTMDLEVPKKSTASGKYVTDWSFLSPDCVHFSQRGQSVTANALWNNMLEPVGNKSRNWNTHLMERFLCPTPEHPYFFTHANSQT